MARTESTRRSFPGTGVAAIVATVAVIVVCTAVALGVVIAIM